MKNKKLWVSVVAGFMALMMLFGLVSSLIPVRAEAKSSSEIRNQIDALEARQEEIQDEMAQLQEQQSNNYSNTEELVREKSMIDQQVGLLYEKIANTNQQIESYNVLIADKQEELDQAQKNLDDLSEKNRQRIRAMEESGTMTYWSVLFQANSFSDLLDRINMMEEIASADRRRIRELDEAAKAVAEAQKTLTEEKEALEKTKEELEATKQEWSAKREEANAVLADLVKESQNLDSQYAEFQKRNQEMIEEIASAEFDFDEAVYREWLATSETTTVPTEPPETEPEETAPAYTDPEETEPEETEPEYNEGDGSGDIGGGEESGGPVYGGDWIIPCDYVYLSSPFGWREPPTDGASTFHSGVDLAGYDNAPIWAARGGVVTEVGYNEYNGYFVRIDHGDGFVSVYLHLSHYIASYGQHIAQGETLGYMGSTGISTGTHLHLSIYHDGELVNPADYISFY